MQTVPFDGWVKRDGVEDTYPRNVNGSARTSSGAAWNWSAYGQIVASTSEDFLPISLVANLKLTALVATTSGVIIEYQIYTGLLNEEVLLASFTFAYTHYISNPGADTQGMSVWGQTVPFATKVIPSGTRLSNRIRTSEADTLTIADISTYVYGYKNKAPILYKPYSLRGHHSGINKAVSKIANTGAKINVTTSWTEILPSAPTDLLFWGGAREQNALFGSFSILEIGTGDVDSEVARAKLPFPSTGIVGGSGTVTLPLPLLVKTGERLAAKRVFGSNEDYMFFYEALPG